MTIFKTYWKLVRYYKKELIIPLLIFVGFSFLSESQANSSEKTFQEVVPIVAIANHDTQVGQGLIDYLEDKVVFESVIEDHFEEALFYRQVSFTLVIPENFTSLFLEQGQGLEAQIFSDSALGYIVQSYIDDYLSYYQSFSRLGYNHEEIQTMIMNVTGQQPDVEILSDSVQKGSYKLMFFSNMSLYPVFTTVMSMLISVLMAFNKKEVEGRTMISSYSTVKRNSELFLGTFMVGHVLWLIMLGISFFFMKHEIMMDSIGLTVLNSYVLFLVSMSFAFLVSKIVNTSNGQSAISNSVGLGLSFISGVFVPREILAASITNVAKLFPFYWNVEVNELIYNRLATLNTAFVPILIQLLYASVLFLVAMIISRNRKSV